MLSQVPSYHDYRFPSEIISHAVWLACQVEVDCPNLMPDIRCLRLDSSAISWGSVS